MRAIAWTVLVAGLGFFASACELEEQGYPGTRQVPGDPDEEHPKIPGAEEGPTLGG